MTTMDPGQGDDLASKYLDRLRRLEETLATLGAAGGQALFSAAPPAVTWYVDHTRRALADAELVASLSRDTGLLTAGWALPASPALPRIARVPGQPDRLTVADDAEAWRVASILADAAGSPFLYRLDLDDAPVVHFLAVANIRAPAPSPHAGSEALGPGFRYFLAAFGLVALALSLGLAGYGMTSDSSGRGHPLAGLSAVVGVFAIMAGVVVLLIGAAVGAFGFRAEKRAAIPPSIGGEPLTKAPAGQPYRRMEVVVPQPRDANPRPASARRLAVCSFATTLLPWLGALVDNKELLVFFVVIALMLSLATGVMTSLVRAVDPGEVRDRRHAWGWLVAGALSLGLLFMLLDVLGFGSPPAAR
jgi:hypothetical protein